MAGRSTRHAVSLTVFIGPATVYKSLMCMDIARGPDMNKRLNITLPVRRQWIKEGKQAAHWTRLSCHRFRANEVRLQLSVLAYNLGNLWRRLVLPRRIDSWRMLPILGSQIGNVGEDLLTRRPLGLDAAPLERALSKENESAGDGRRWFDRLRALLSNRAAGARSPDTVRPLRERPVRGREQSGESQWTLCGAHARG